MTGLNILLEGESGSGKTYSLRTLVDAGIETCVLFTEPPGTVLSDIPCPKLHWHYIPPATQPWSAMIDSATKINTLSMKGLANLDGVNKREHNQFIRVLDSLSNFKCDRCDAELGDVSTWDGSRAIVLDSLSGLNIMAMDLVVGSKPVKSIADWGIAMDNLSRIISKLTTDTKCHFIMNAHLEPERDEVTGRVMNMTSTLGRKLAPVVPRFFDDVITTIRDGDKFRWSTAEANTALKARDLPISANLAPSYIQLIDKWRQSTAHSETATLKSAT